MQDNDKSSPVPFSVSIPPWEYKEPFVPKETHADRAKPNQPFYEKLGKRRRKK